MGELSGMRRAFDGIGDSVEGCTMSKVSQARKLLQFLIKLEYFQLFTQSEFNYEHANSHEACGISI